MGGWSYDEDTDSDKKNKSKLNIDTGRNYNWSYDDYQEPENTESYGKSMAMAVPRIAYDIASGAAGAVGQIPELYRKSKTEVPGFLNKKNAVNNLKQLAAGNVELGHNLLNLPAGLTEYATNRLNLLPAGLNKFVQNNLSQRDISGDINSIFGEPSNSGAGLARGISRNAPNLIPAANLSKFAAFLASKGGRSAVSALSKSALSAAKITGKTAKIAGNALYRGEVPGAAEVLRGTLTPAELERNLRITAGTETGLGDVIGSPGLKRFGENYLSKIPGSGINSALQRTANSIVQKGHKILKDIQGPTDINDFDFELKEALAKSHEKERLLKSGLYNEANTLAEQHGLNLELPNFAKKAKHHIEAIEDTNILKYEPDLKKLINKITKYKNPVEKTVNKSIILDKSGKPFIKGVTTKHPTLQEALLLKGRLGELARDYNASISPNDTNLARVIFDLHETLKSDIENEILKSGNSNLRNAYMTAEKNYKDNYSPFLEKTIRKFVTGKSDPETLISSIVKTGKATDRGGLISRFNNRLPETHRNLLGARYLQRTLDENGNINPLKFKTAISSNSLGPKQFNALFPDKKIQNAIREYSDLIGMNTKALTLMQNPATGQMLTDLIPLVSGSPLSLPFKMLGSRYLGGKLHSEKTRENLVKKMLENESKKVSK